MSYEVENSLIQNRLRELAKQITAWIPKGWGFTLFIFSYGEKGSLFYISSAQREDMISTVKEWLAKQEGGTL